MCVSLLSTRVWFWSTLGHTMCFRLFVRIKVATATAAAFRKCEQHSISTANHIFISVMALTWNRVAGKMVTLNRYFPENRRTRRRKIKHNLPSLDHWYCTPLVINSISQDDAQQNACPALDIGTTEPSGALGISDSDGQLRTRRLSRD